MHITFFRLLLLSAVGLLTALFSRAASAQSAASAPHLRVELVARDAALAPGRELRLGLHFRLEKGWHIYWRNPGDSGQAPRVRWTFTEAGGGPQTELVNQFTVDDLAWPTPHRLVTGPLANYGYEDEVVLLTSLHAPAGLRAKAVTLTAAVSWLVCSEPCIPGEAQLALRIPVDDGSGAAPPGARLQDLFAAAERALPTALPQGVQLSGLQDQTAFHLRIELPDAPIATRAQFFPFHADEIENAAEQVSTQVGTALALKVSRAEQLAKPLAHLDGVLRIEAPNQLPRAFSVEIPLSAVPVAAPVAAPPQAAPPASTAPAISAPAPVSAPPQPANAPPILLALLFALLGGMLLNLMPCVFPVLCIKALGLVEMAAIDRQQARRHALLYGAGILVSFWVLSGVLIALRYTGQQIGWGFQLQSPRFLIGLSALLFLLGLNLLGVFELGIGLTRLGQLTVRPEGARRGDLNAFATGVLATLVATPCTAPFMGTAVGFALGQPAFIALLIFSALGIGLALPYVLLPFVPGLLRILPRPGAWMETFKHVMGFLLLGTVLWLAWVLGAQCGAERVVALFCGLLVIGIAAWVLQRWPEPLVATAIAGVLIVAGALAPGWGLQQRRAEAQHQTTNSDDDLPWERYSPERLASYRGQGQPVFLDFTAEWCVSCKVNERLVLRTSEVRTRIRELGIIPMKADWTSYDPVITQKLAEHGRSGIPFYVFYGRTPNAPGIELPAVITTSSVLRVLEQVARNPPNQAPH